MATTTKAKAPAAQSTEPILRRADSGGVATLTLNRPGARNALSVGLMSALQDALDAIAKDRAIKVVVIGSAARTRNECLSFTGPPQGRVIENRRDRASAASARRTHCPASRVWI